MFSPYLFKVYFMFFAVQTKGKFNRWTGERYQLPRHVIVTSNTLLMLKTLISNRKKGYIFEGRDGASISKRYMQAQIDKYARLLSIQQLRKYAQSKTNPDDNRELPLVTLMALRKEGERHVDANGGDPSLRLRQLGTPCELKSSTIRENRTGKLCIRVIGSIIPLLLSGGNTNIVVKEAISRVPKS